MVGARYKRAEVPPLDGLAGRERKSAEGSAMKAVVERDEVLAAGVITRQLHGGFNRLRARVPEVDLLGENARRELTQPLSQIHHLGKVEIGSGNMDQLLRLRMDCLDHLGMRMSRGAHRDAGSEIEENV